MGHNSTKLYLEYYAKMLLETLYPDRYMEIIKGESPDLHMSNGHGVEVTWAMFENQGQAGGILNHIKGKEVDKIDQRYLKTMRRIHTELIFDADGKICGYIPIDAKNKANYTDIIKAYEQKKIKKYKTKHTDLFIYPPLAQLDGWLGENIIKECCDVISNDPENPFRNIFIFEEPTLYRFSIHNKVFQSKRGAQEQIMQCKKAADVYSGWSKRKKDIE